MRFPRALDIRDDLTISDCMTATGVYDVCSGANVYINVSLADVMERVKFERKRKMEDSNE
jgi:hypothetical protein